MDMKEETFQVKSRIDRREYGKFYRFMLSRNRWLMLLIAALILGAAAALLSVLTGQGRAGLRPAAYCLLMLALLWFFLCKKGPEKAWRENLRVQGECETLTFTKNEVRVEGALGVSAFSYERIEHLYETAENFYIMLNSQQGMIVVKRDCPQELLAWLGEKKQELA